MPTTDKRYTYQMKEGATATFNTPTPSAKTLEAVEKVIELARNYHPKVNPRRNCFCCGRMVRKERWIYPNEHNSGHHPLCDRCYEGPEN